MKPRSYTSEGIVIARRNFGEADRILSVFTRDHGKVSLIAMGVRRPKSRKRGHVEVFNHLRFQSTIGRGIDLMTEAEVIDDFKEIRLSLKKISLAYYITEVIGRITHDQEVNIDLFNLIFDTFTKLKKSTKLKEVRLDFLLKLLVVTGYWPTGISLPNPDKKLEEVIERQIYSERVGKIVLS